ncbi:MAG: FecR domain-containing protein [Bacteroidales bacterium]|nr:FecR domain-containing protein [Bacteroidales bacterium]
MSKNRDIEMARYLAGEMSMNEEIAFLNRSGSSRKQRSELRDMEKHWKYFDQNPSAKSWKTGKAWNQLHQRLESEGLLEERLDEPVTGSRVALLRIAATVLLVLAVGIPSIYFGVIRDSGSSMQRSHQAEEGVSIVNLPDGSRVYLNQGSEITYQKAFNQHRAIELSGEAFFEVMSDPVNPFTVHSGNVRISVVGTSFNVKQLENTPEVEVYVKTGKVRMSLEESDQYVTLEPEEFGFTENSKLSSSVLEVPNYISWKTLDFKFVDSKLMDVLQELEESYHVEIKSGEIDLSQMRITTSYSGQSIDAILETIGTAFGMTVSHENDGYILTK